MVTSTLTVRTKEQRVCESCIEAALAEGADYDFAERACEVMGAELIDHVCEQVHEPDTKCSCGCRSLR